jgi:NTP pyrophosphatase (non-canonical NTP hydrolase)
VEIVIPDELYELIWEIEERIDTDNQLTQLAEEAAELSQAALKYRRAIQTARWEENISPTPKTLNEAYDSLVEECSDVMLAVLVTTRHLMSNDIMLNKAKRWLDRLKHYRDEEGEND